MPPVYNEVRLAEQPLPVLVLPNELQQTDSFDPTDDQDPLASPNASMNSVGNTSSNNVNLPEPNENDVDTSQAAQNDELGASIDISLAAINMSQVTSPENESFGNSSLNLQSASQSRKHSEYCYFS